MIPFYVREAWARWRYAHGHPVVMHKEDELDAMSRVSILAICGLNGSGKSLLAAELCRRSLLAGRRVLSTARLLDFENPRPCPGGAECDDPDWHEYEGKVHGAAHPLYVRWTRWGQIEDMGTRFDVWGDEISNVASSRESSSLPKYAQQVLHQLRRRDAVFRWTSPTWSRGDLLLREVTMGVVMADGFSSYVDADSGRRYPRRRMFRWDLYEKGVGDVSSSALLDPGPVAGTWFWGPGSEAFGVYDTLAPVSIIGRVIGTGVCEVCEGSRRRPECSCADYREERAARRAGSPLGGRVGAHAPALAVLDDEEAS